MKDPRFAALAQKFRARATADRDKLMAAIERGDRSEAQSVAHGLAGISGIFGYTEIGRLAANLEQTIISGGQDLRSAIGPLLEALDILQ